MHTSEDFEALLKGNKLLPHFTIFGTTDDETTCSFEMAERNRLAE